MTEELCGRCHHELVWHQGDDTEDDEPSRACLWYDDEGGCACEKWNEVPIDTALKEFLETRGLNVPIYVGRPEPG